MLGFLVFGGPLECVCLCVCGAQQEITTTREMEPIKILQIHASTKLVYMCVYAACTNRAVARVRLIQFSYSPAYTHTQRHLARSFAPTHTHIIRERRRQRERENAAPDGESLIRQAAIAVVVHNSPQSPPLPWLSAGNRS